MGDRIEYVLGFAFWNDQVVLIEKKRGPPVVLGRLNGVGGKVEIAEGADHAMTREFYEETGSVVPPAAWEQFCTLYGDWGRVHCFRTELTDGRMESIHMRELSLTEEVVDTYPIGVLPSNVVPNLNWLVPMALDMNVVHPTRVYVP